MGVTIDTTGDAAVSPSVDAVLAASRTLMAVTARSIAAVESSADFDEVRVLVIVSAHTVASLRQVADGLGRHTSTTSRLCDRMVANGLLDRRDDPTDRRQLALRLTAAGERVVRKMLAGRRRSIERVLARMPDERRAGLAAALGAFADAAGEMSEHDLWGIGWTR